MRTVAGVIAVSVFLVIAFLVGTWVGWRGSEPEGDEGPRILYYVDPMHPAYRSDKPGIAPDCGMKLEPVYEGGGEGGPEGEEELLAMIPGAVRIAPEKQQLIGVKKGIVEERAGTHTIRITGRVAVDETRLYRITSAVTGWIEEALPVTVGSFVKKGQPLGYFYAPEFLQTIQGYFYALRSLDRIEKIEGVNADQLDTARAAVEQYREGLRDLGMEVYQLDELARTRELTDRILIAAPTDGFVLTRNITTGQRFEKSAELFTFADLSHVWVLADIFENEAQFFKPGVTARISLPHQNRRFRARVSDTLPQFDAKSRTLNIRLEVKNPEFILKPDMFVDVELPIRYAATIAVPVDAVIDSGLRKTVYVDRGNGYFEPRLVETGWRRGGLIEVTKGLAPGEQIVISGTFLVDSESKIKAAAAGIYGTAVMDPVCGMYIDEEKAGATGRKIEHGGKTYYFCSPECKKEFEAAPREFIENPGHKRHIADTLDASGQH